MARRFGCNSLPICRLTQWPVRLHALEMRVAHRRGHSARRLCIKSFTPGLGLCTAVNSRLGPYGGNLPNSLIPQRVNEGWRLGCELPFPR